MTATDKLRAMLDERGIHWWAGESENQTRWESRGLTWEFEEGIGLTFLGVCEYDVTPEQAIAATMGNAQEPSDAVIERIERFCTDYAQCLVDATLHDKRPFDAVDHRTCERMEAVEAKLIRELAEDVATTGRSCASCPEMDNPDSFIVHLMQCERGTCHGKFSNSSDLSSGRVPLYYCENKNKSIFVERDAEVCPLCGARIEASE